MFNKEIDDAIVEIEKQQKALLEKMAAKVVDLEGHVRTLEVLLANFEIRHVTSEIDDDTYQRESELLSIGLESARRELEEVKGAADQLASGDFTLEQEAESQAEQEPEAQQLQDAQPTEEEAHIPEEPAVDEDEAEILQETVVEEVSVTEAPMTEPEMDTEEEQEA